MKLVTNFYVINPAVHPIPSGADLICIENGNNVSSNIRQLYDPFNVDENCTRFIAWMEPIPYTTPLYFMKNGNELYISFQKDSKFPLADIPAVYVLLDPRITDVYRVPPPQQPEVQGGKTTFEINPDNTPFFTFSGYQNKCIPNPNGDHLGRCIVITEKDVGNVSYIGLDDSLLTYLQYRYGKQPKRNYVFLLALLVVLVILFFVYLYK
ncbi:MAG: hypothetical protein JSS09_04140 [Verrucomicrobia bacterium]|nr:hypothetical protein [Verrucomicrobiota bacterium]